MKDNNIENIIVNVLSAIHLCDVCGRLDLDNSILNATIIVLI